MIHTYYNDKARSMDIVTYGSVHTIALEMALQEIYDFYPLSLKFDRFISDETALYDVLTYTTDPVGQVKVHKYFDSDDNLIISVNTDFERTDLNDE